MEDNNQANPWEWSLGFLPILFPGRDMCNCATEEPIIGNGHASDKIRLKPGQNVGDVLKWDGQKWVLGEDLMGNAIPRNWEGEVISDTESSSSIGMFSIEGKGYAEVIRKVITITSDQSHDEVLVDVDGNSLEAFTNITWIIDTEVGGGNPVTLQLPRPNTANTVWNGVVHVIGGRGSGARIVRIDQTNALQATRGLGIDEVVTQNGNYIQFEIPEGKMYTFTLQSNGSGGREWVVVGKWDNRVALAGHTHNSDEISDAVDSSTLQVHTSNANAVAAGIAQGSPYLYDNGDTHLLAFVK